MLRWTVTLVVSVAVLVLPGAGFDGAVEPLILPGAVVTPGAVVSAWKLFGRR